MVTYLLDRFYAMPPAHETSPEWSLGSQSTLSDGPFERRHSTQSATLYEKSSTASSPIVQHVQTEPFMPTSYRTSWEDGQAEVREKRESVMDSIGHRKYKNPWRQVNILAIDGGGLKGLWALFVLKELMNKVQALENARETSSSVASPLDEEDTQDTTNIEIRKTLTGKFLLCHYFDYISGASEGGLLSIMFGRLRLTIDQALNNYGKLWTLLSDLRPTISRTLPVKRKRSQATKIMMAKIEELLRERPRDADFASDSQMCKTIVMCVATNQKGVHPYLFRSYEFKRMRKSSNITRNPESKTKFLTKDVCQASFGAPFYFESVKLGGQKYSDGSIWTTNPSLEVYREVSTLHDASKRPIRLFLNVGGGISSVKPSRLQSLPFMRAAMYLRSAVSQSEERLISQTLSEKAKQDDFEYFRIGGATQEQVEEFNTRSKKVISAQETFALVQKWVKIRLPEFESTLDQCAQQLADCRRERAATAQWERFALGIHYDCNFCEKGWPPVSCNRNDFIEHLQKKHDFAPPDAAHWEEIQIALQKCMVTS